MSKHDRRQYVVIRDMSAGNAETGEAWQETKIFEDDDTLEKVMLWAVGYTVYDKDIQALRKRFPEHSARRVTITLAHSDEKSE